MGFYEEYPFLGYVIPPVIAMLGDKLWDKSAREHTQEYREALAEALFGSAEYTAIFNAVGDLIPPRKKTLFIPKNAKMPTAETVDACLKSLHSVANPNCMVTAQKYVGLFEKIKEQIESEASS